MEKNFVLLTIKQNIEKAMCEALPIDSLRELAIKLNKSGVEKNKILSEFYAYCNKLKSAERDAEVDFLEDVIDMMTGYYVGRNLDLK